MYKHPNRLISQEIEQNHKAQHIETATFCFYTRTSDPISNIVNMYSFRVACANLILLVFSFPTSTIVLIQHLFWSLMYHILKHLELTFQCCCLRNMGATFTVSQCNLPPDTALCPSTWNIHTPGLLTLLVEFSCRTSSVPDPFRAKNLNPISPALKPTWAEIAHPFSLSLPLPPSAPLHDSAAVH